MIFSNFADFWRHTKDLSEKQREIIYENLTPAERKYLEKSYKDGGWNDVFTRNLLDSILDNVKQQTGQDLLEIRIKVLKGKQFLMHRKMWELVEKSFSDFKPDHLSYIFGGISFEEHDKEWILVKGA